jgi:hypothetical protein
MPFGTTARKENAQKFCNVECEEPVETEVAADGVKRSGRE